VIAFNFDGIRCVRWRKCDYLPTLSFGASDLKTLDRCPRVGAVDRKYGSWAFYCAIARLYRWCGRWDRLCAMLPLLTSLSSRNCGALLGIMELSDDGESREQRSGALLKARERSLWRPQNKSLYWICDVYAIRVYVGNIPQVEDHTAASRCSRGSQPTVPYCLTDHWLEPEKWKHSHPMRSVSCKSWEGAYSKNLVEWLLYPGYFQSAIQRT
jgi:hypothetical protein